MNKVYFAMGLHFHQPVGNFEEILERAYQNCYKPFLDVFSKYPDLKMAFHISGNLLDYFEEKYPEFLDKVKALVDKGQVEIIGGGFYEPIFQAIPKIDRIGQIEMLTRFSENRFGVRPIGLWVPERVWSPEIIPELNVCGMKYAILDDAHLIKAGVDKDNLYGYFLTGEEDAKIAIFPSDKALRYTIPFRPPRETMDYFKSIMAKKQDPLFTYGDDAEKFGEWPYTHAWVYKKGWLNSFFKDLTRNIRWIETIKFSDCLSLFKPLKDVRIPEASYEEMMEWANGSWMNYLERYPESNQMHKRMWHTSQRIKDLVCSDKVAMKRDRLAEAKRELFKAQTNCSYWHGVFGGIYLYHLRKAVYEHLINADKISDEVEHAQEDGWSDIKEMDFYNSGRQTVIMQDKDFFICVDPANGGAIRELDYKPESWNLVNTLARREESYHKKIMDRINKTYALDFEIHEAIKIMDKGIKNGIYYDKNIRACLIEHFIDKDLSKNDFANCNYTDKGDFQEGTYRAGVEDRKAVLTRSGRVNDRPVHITKEISIIAGQGIEIDYTLKNQGDSGMNTCFGIEFNITMPNGQTDRYSEKGDAFILKDYRDELGVELRFSEGPKKIWHFPVKTVSQSERAYDLSYQCSCIFPIWDIKLASGEETSFNMKISIKK